MQQNIKFDQDTLIHEQNSMKTKIIIDRIHFYPTEDWSDRLAQATIAVIFTCIGKDGLERNSSMLSDLPLSEYIVPDRVVPLFEINRAF